MEASNLPPLPGQPRSPGELVVQTGRLIGRRVPLLEPRTLIGQASCCDVRLSEAGVEAVHCAVTHDPIGLVLIDLGSPTGTRVNGEPVTARRLVNNDLIDVGPYRFAVALGTPPTAEVPSAGVIAEQGAEALRVQAAAVAAQQAALFEEEIRLEQRGTALGRQEEQLSSHLETRQRKLDEQEHGVRDERTVLAAEIESARQAVEAERQAAARERAAAATERHKAAAGRDRVAALRRRLRQRFKRQYAAKESALARREADLVAGTQRLQDERAKVRAFQERLNGELEVGRRQLREEQQELALEQQRWEESLNAEKAEQQRTRRELQLLAAEAEGARQALAAQQREAEEKLARLGREAEGLEARARNQRSRLEAIERDLAAAQVPTPPSSAEPIIPPPAATNPPRLVPEQLDFAVQEIMDQRLRLAEQWERFLQVQQSWEQDRGAVLAALEADAASLERREQDLRQSEQEVASARAYLARQQETAVALRGALEGSQTRLLAERAEWQTRHDGLLADLDGRERLLTIRSEQLEEIHRQRRERRQEEDARLAEDRARTEEARRQYSSLWQECERQRETLARQERELGVRALALERYRHETLQQTPDSARAELQLTKVEKSERSRHESEAQRIEQQRQLLIAERQRLDELTSSLRRREDELAEGIRRWEQIQTVRDADALATREAQEQREQELRRLRAQHAIDERQLRQLREELERIARMLIEDGDQAGRGQAPAAA
jgi:hypothetical protein